MLRSFVGASLSAFLFSTTALAAPVESIVVTGVRTPVSLDEMATATTVLDRSLLDLRQSFQVIDVLRDVPGLTIAQAGASGSQAQLRMRGAEGNHVLVLIDGIEVNDPANGDEFLFEHLSAMEVDRIEVIRGPQSALWGSDAVAGVIHVVTREAEKGFSGSGSLEAGSHETLTGSARAAWGEEKWSLVLGGSYSETDGSNISRVGDEVDGHTLLTGQMRLRAELSESLRFGGTLRWVDAETESDPVDFLTGIPTDGDRLGTFERLIVGASLDGEQGRWVHKTGLSWFDSDNENFVSGVLDTTTRAERWKAFHQSTFDVVEGHRVTLAVDYRETDFEQTGPVSFFGDPNYARRMTNLGGVVDYVGEWAEMLTVMASVRHDDNSDFDDVTTWRLGASFDVSEETRLRGSWGRGQKAPTFGDRFGYTPDTFIGNPDLKPEVSDSFEVGVDQMLLEGRATLGLTYFNATLEDEINGFSYDPMLFMFTAVNKDGESERQGVEVTFDYALSAHWSLSSNYTWTKAEEPNGLNGMQREVRRPEHAGAVSLTYRAENGGSLSLSASLVGEADDLDFATFPASTVTLPEYGIISVAGEAPLTEQASFFGRVSLPTNRNYETVYGFATPDLVVRTGVKVRF